MTDHDAIPEPLASALRGWAAATDPAADLVGGPSIRAGVADRARWTGRRTLLVAAALLVALLATSVVWALGGDDPDTVVTDPDPAEEGVRLDVLVDTAGVDLQLPSADRAVRLEPVCGGAGPCGDAPAGLPRPVELGASLVWSGRVPAGTTWDVVVDSWSCGGHCPVELDGTPPPDDQREPRTCRDRIVVGGPTVAVLGITTAAPDTLTCGVTVDGPTPRLTVPPSFTLRERYPWSCGAGAVRPGDAVTPTPEAEQADLDARACLAEAMRRGGTAELPVQEVGAADGLERSWWRTSPDEGLVLVRAPDYPGGGRWTTSDCTGLVEDRLGRFQPDGCADPREIDVVYRPPADGEAPPSTTTPPGDAGDGRELVVVFADAGDAEPTVADRWVLVEDGRALADGPLTPLATSLESVDLPTGGDVSIRWDRLDCLHPCPAPGPDGIPVGFATIDTTACEEAIPTGAGPVVVRFQSVDGAPGGAMCDVTTPDALPALTVPPAWSLRERYPTDCGVEGTEPDGTERACFVEAATAGRPMELTTSDDREGPGRQTTVWRVTPAGVTVTVPPTREGERWLQLTCAEVRLEAPMSIDADGCGGEEVMSLDPP